MEIPQGELTRLKTDIRNLQEELAALKRDTITPIEEKVNKISADTDSTNKRLDKLEESITGRFDELVNLITTRLPPITAHHPAVPADDVMESTPASIKRAAQPASQIITRRNYASPSHSRTSTTADSAKKTKTNNA
jgi:chromosome segregation ATPase